MGKILLEQNTVPIVKSSMGSSNLFAVYLPVSKVLGSRITAEFTLSFVAGVSTSNISRVLGFYCGSSKPLLRTQIGAGIKTMARQVSAVITSLDNSYGAIRCSIGNVLNASTSFEMFDNDLIKDAELFTVQNNILIALPLTHTYEDEITVLEHYAIWRITED